MIQKPTSQQTRSKKRLSAPATSLAKDSALVTTESKLTPINENQKSSNDELTDLFDFSFNTNEDTKPTLKVTNSQPVKKTDNPFLQMIDDNTENNNVQTSNPFDDLFGTQQIHPTLLTGSRESRSLQPDKLFDPTMWDEFDDNFFTSADSKTKPKPTEQQQQQRQSQSSNDKNNSKPSDNASNTKDKQVKPEKKKTNNQTKNKEENNDGSSSDDEKTNNNSLVLNSSNSNKNTKSNKIDRKNSEAKNNNNTNTDTNGNSNSNTNNNNNDTNPKEEEKLSTNALEELHRGSALLKYPHNSGFPHFKHVQLSMDNTRIQWFSKRKSLNETCIYVKDIRQVVSGQETQVFQKFQQKTLEKSSFSVVYGITYKTLDVAAKTIDEAQMWVLSLRKLQEMLKNKEDITKLKELDVGIRFRDRNRPRTRQGSGNFVRANNAKELKIDTVALREIEKEMEVIQKTFERTVELATKPEIAKSLEHNNVQQVISELEERIEELAHELENIRDTELAKREVWRVNVDLSAILEKIEVLMKVPSENRKSSLF